MRVELSTQAKDLHHMAKKKKAKKAKKVKRAKRKGGKRKSR
jgi:hypothetical protein